MSRSTAVRTLVATCALVALGSPSRGQEVALPDPVLAPSAEVQGSAPVVENERSIDLANVVTSAAKGLTTVQEAPAIITILTAEELKARGVRTVQQALQTIPGWMEAYGIGHQLALPGVRGTFQAALVLQDGVSMFDPWGNIPWLTQTLPIETIQRIEVVTGPGGVLWGANSYLGIINIIMKDAEDVRGVESSLQYGDGPGNRQNVRAYAQAGARLWKGRLKLYQHVSYESLLGAVFNGPQFIASSPAPQPAGIAFYGPESSRYYAPFSTDPGRSWMLNLTGRYSLGPVTLTYRIPVGNNYSQLVFANAVVPNSIVNVYDRYAALEYRDRFWKDRFGVTIKAYYTQFVRNFSIQLYPGSSLFPSYTEPNGRHNIGGLHFEFPTQLSQRMGGTVDFDLTLPRGLRLLFGGEAFYESISGSTTYFNSHVGAADGSPLNTAGALPLVCPQRIDPSTGVATPIPGCPRQFSVDASRIVGAAFANLQYRPVSKLTLDGGIRLQKGFGARPYDFVPLYSAAAVWNFAPGWHMKANYTTGFRPTVFNNTEAVPGGVSYGSSPDLKPETSQAFQAELNARLLRNVRRVRELELRIDYAYTFLDQLISIRAGSYQNTGKRGIHSVEALSKLYLQGDHLVSLAYTFLHISATDVGRLRAVPTHSLTLGGSFQLVRRLLSVNSSLVVTSAFADPNRTPTISSPIPGATTGALASDLTFDRLTPVALLQLGFNLRLWGDRLGLSGQFYNVLNQRYYYPDVFYDFVPSIEMTPTPAPGFSFMSAITLRN